MALDPKLKEQLPQLTERIVETYHRTDLINHLGHCPLPRYSVVVEILDGLREILFPGYRRREGLHRGNIAYYVGDLVDRLHDSLTTQIARALQHEARVRENTDSCLDPIDYETRGGAIALQFLARVPALRSILATDVEAAFQGDPAVTSRDEIIFCYPGLEAITVHRLAHELYRLAVPFIPRMMAEWAHKETGIDIHPGATIGDHFFIDHGTGVVIGETCQIGDHVKVYQGVTLGALSFKTDDEGSLIRGTKRHPTIEDRVVLYANATVLGGQTVIGHDSVLGSSVWVTSSIEPHTTVTLEKPKLRLRGTTAERAGYEPNYQI